MKKIFFTTSLIIVSFITHSQTSVNSSGGFVSNNSGSLSYSIGQVAYQSVSNNSGTVSQGVQQAYVVSTLNLKENKFNFSLSAYPNPTADVLNLHVENYNQEKLIYSLKDVEGKQVLKGNIQTQDTKLDLLHLPVSTYFVELFNEGKKVQTFKIIKNQ